MAMFRTIQIIFGVIGLLAIFAGDRFSMPVLIYGGIVSFGFMATAIGWEAIITRHIVVGSRRRGLVRPIWVFPPFCKVFSST